MWIGALFLIGLTIVTAANVTVRLFRGSITGTYELIQFFIVVAAGFALVYTTVNKSHVKVDMIVSRLPRLLKVFFRIFNVVISFGIMTLITWENIAIMYERTLMGEKSEMLLIPYFPFRFLWVFALILCCLILLRDLAKTLTKEGKK
jgi:TRAP-type C4-dicarboxylate transport system permease small subunit